MNNSKEVKERLSYLREMGLPHLTPKALCERNKVFAENWSKASLAEQREVEKYLYKFYDNVADNNPDNKCIWSEEYPVLSWSLQHGVCYDENTKLSWVCIHYLELGSNTARYDMQLQLHPDQYRWRER